jgi:hypothetical protein
MTQLRLRPAVDNPGQIADIAKSVLGGKSRGLRRQTRRLLGLSEHELRQRREPMHES